MSKTIEDGKPGSEHNELFETWYGLLTAQGGIGQGLVVGEYVDYVFQEIVNDTVELLSEATPDAHAQAVRVAELIGDIEVQSWGGWVSGWETTTLDGLHNINEQVTAIVEAALRGDK